ncbi:MAG: hypothetical protein RMM58_10005 [Chloroflexota bacterium]|nr:hypothetical protein [Dehalococcoidia bacterium]MDW8254200.1 hypothetical protein [Chloroflexota bacterium]
MTETTLLLGMLVGAVSLLILTESWRVSLPSLLLTYGVMAVLVGIETNPAIGAVQLLVGMFTGGVLFSALRILPQSAPATVQYAFGLPYRIATGVFAVSVAYSLASTYPVAEASPALNFGVYWLAAVGLITLVLARRVLTTAYAIFLLEEVASVFLSLFSEGPGLARLLLAGIVQLAIAVAVAYLLYIEREGELA